MPVVFSEYPKFIEVDKKQVLIHNEEEYFKVVDKAEIDKLVKKIKKEFDEDIDLRRYKGPNGLPSLKGYYKALKDGNRE